MRLLLLVLLACATFLTPFGQNYVHADTENAVPHLTQTLLPGMADKEVGLLQNFLKKFERIYPEGLTTGYFGRLTQAAVARFQKAMSIEPVGIVGPKTRAKINELMAAVAAADKKERNPNAAIPATPATPAIPNPGQGPATPAIPATPATPKPFQEQSGPILSNVEVKNITSTSVEITWNTDIDSTTSAIFSTSPTFATFIASTSALYTLLHRIKVSGLQASTTYYFVASSQNRAGMTGTSATLSFTTLRATSTPPTDFQPGLVSYWKLDETSGTAVDSVGSNNLANTNVAFTSGAKNNAAVFNGSTSKLQISDSSQSGLDITGNISISLWVKITTPPGPWATPHDYPLVQKGELGLGAERSYDFVYQDNSAAFGGMALTIFLYGNADQSNASRIRWVASTYPSVDLGTSTWHHLVVSCVTANPLASKCTLYVDGTSLGNGDSNTEAGSGATSIYNSNAPLTIGTEPLMGSGSNYETLNGLIDEVRIWNRAISSSEVTALATFVNKVSTSTATSTP